MRTRLTFTARHTSDFCSHGQAVTDHEIACYLAKRAQTKGKKVSGPHFLSMGWDLCLTFDHNEYWLLLQKCDQHYALTIDSVWDWRALLGRKHHTRYRQFVLEVVAWLQSDGRFSQIEYGS